MKKKKKHSGVKIVLPLLLVLLLAGAIAGCAWALSYDRIYPGVTALGVDLAGMTEEEANQAVAGNYSARSVTARLEWTDTAGEAQSAEESFETVLDTASVARAAYNVGREGSVFSRLGAVVGAYFSGHDATAESEIDTSGLDEFVQLAAERIDHEAVDSGVQILKDSIVIGPSSGGQKLDGDAVEAELLRRIYAADGDGVTLDLGEYITESSAELPDVDAVYKELYRAPVDAAYVLDEESGEVTVSKEAVGVSFDLDEAKRLLKNSPDGFTVPIIYTEPEKYSADLEEALFRDKLASCTTTMNKWNYNRTGNVKLSAEAINGTILMPGDEFSYNDTVGERTYERGFRDASVYVSDGIENQLGGGICQTSSTLYMACIRSRLEITQRKNHRYTTAYTPDGEDATVYWGSLDYRFKNNRDYPIKIVAWQEDDYITVEILGTDVDGYTVTVENVRLSYTPYNTIQKENPDMEYGTTKQISEGHPQLKCETYAVVKDKDGNQVDRYLIATSSYTRLDRVVAVGTKNAPTAPASTTPEPTPAATDTPEPTPGEPTVNPEPTPGEPTVDPEPTPGEPTVNPEPTPGEPTVNPEPTPGEPTVNPEPTPGESTVYPEPTPGESTDNPEPAPTDEPAPDETPAV